MPFGPPPEYFNYRCSQCQYEYEINEAIIDDEIDWAEIEGRYYEGYMPVLRCPNCNKKTLKYVRDYKPAP